MKIFGFYFIGNLVVPFKRDPHIKQLEAEAKAIAEPEIDRP